MKIGDVLGTISEGKGQVKQGKPVKQDAPAKQEAQVEQDAPVKQNAPAKTAPAAAAAADVPATPAARRLARQENVDLSSVKAEGPRVTPDDIKSAKSPAAPAKPASPARPASPASPALPALPALFVDKSWAAVEALGEMRTLVLRGRYIELANRILSRVEDPAEQRKLWDEAARLNPEGWTTAEHARDAVVGFDAAYEAIASRIRQQPAV